MTTELRVFWCVTLVMFTEGCSSYTSVGYHQASDETGGEVRGYSSVKVGDLVRVMLADNTMVVGEITVLTSDTLTIDPDESYSHGQPLVIESESELEGLSIALESIRFIEKRQTGSGKTNLLVVGVLAVSFALIGWAISSTGGLM